MSSSNPFPPRTEDLRVWVATGKSSGIRQDRIAAYLDSVNGNPPYSATTLLASHPNSPPEWLDDLIDRRVDFYSGQMRTGLLRMLALNPSLTGEQVKRLWGKYPDEWVLPSILASHPNADPAVLRQIADVALSGEEWGLARCEIVEYLLSNPALPVEVGRLIVRVSFEAIREYRYSGIPAEESTARYLLSFMCDLSDVRPDLFTHDERSYLLVDAAAL